MRHPYLVCIPFGMPSIHIFTFVMFYLLVSIIFDVNLKHSQTEVEEYSFKCTTATTPELEIALTVQ